MRTQIANAADMRNVSPFSQIHATQVAGSLTGAGRGGTRDVAVAVNGRIEAVGQTFRLRGSQQGELRADGARAALRPGRNTVELFEVTAKGTRAPA